MEIKIYYNDVVIGETPRVKPNCPFVTVPVELAKSLAEAKISNGEWTSYLIPDLHHTLVEFEDGIRD